MTTWRLWLIAATSDHAITSQIVEFQTKELAEDAYKSVLAQMTEEGTIQVVRLYMP
jgi:tRNA threonylcarbamoyladenosine modification (KEOPS) complex  Pcc1 subunit